MVSYAQNFEDVVLRRALGGRDRGRYVDVGAYDPVVDSVTKHFYDRGWSGVNVEPVERFHRKFVAERPRDLNLNVAVGATEGEIDFTEWGDSGLSGYRLEFDPRKAIELGFLPTVRRVPMTTLERIARDLPPGETDFLKVDVEGAERDVLSGADWRSFRPRVVVVEAVKPMLGRGADAALEPAWFAWEDVLLGNGFGFALFDGLNRYYFRLEEPQLRERLWYPANVGDNFILRPGHWANARAGGQ